MCVFWVYGRCHSFHFTYVPILLFALFLVVLFVGFTLRHPRHTALHLFQLSILLKTKLSSPFICNTLFAHRHMLRVPHITQWRRGTRAHAHAKLSLPENRRSEKKKEKNQTILWTWIIGRCYFVQAEIRKWRENGPSAHKLHAFASFRWACQARTRAQSGAELQKITKKWLLIA